jgi:hypothetical protein
MNKMSGIVFPALIAAPQYIYKIRQFSFSSGNLRRVGHTSTSTVRAIEIENETKTYWWIYLPASYHDSFYHIRFGPPREVPTQVTGAVAEALSLIIMRKLFQARNIARITPRPSSRTADFEMDIIENGKQVHALVESKGSNRPHRVPPNGVVLDGILQLRTTSYVKSATSGYLTITSYPSKTCFVIKVF